MKRINTFGLLLLLFIGNLAYSQTATNASVTTFQKAYILAKKQPSTFDNFAREYELLKIDGTYYIGALALVDVNSIDEASLEQLSVISDSKINDLWTLRIPIDNFQEVLQIAGIKYLEIGEAVSPELRESTPSARVDSVHQGLGDLARSYSGKGVVIAVIDWGFDYTHPMFYDSTLTDLRLVRAWDQNKIVGTPPEGYNFGAEYKGTQELLAAQADTNYVFGYSSHGTHVGGIAGGAGAGRGYDLMGAAPEAELIFISLRRDAPSLIDAFSYVSNYAAARNKPFVVNMSFGSHLGPHDGTDLKNYGIDIIHGPGKIFVGSAGNNGTGTFHLDYNFKDNPMDTMKTVVNFRPEPDGFGQTLSMWGSEHSDFAVSVLLARGNNDSVYQTPYYSSLDEPNFIDTLLIEGDTLIVRVQATRSFFLNNKPHIRMELKNTGSRKVVLHATSSNTHLHMWNHVRMNNRTTNWGVDLADNYPGAVGGDNIYAIGEPAGSGKSVITVGSYRAEFISPLGNESYGHISTFSSRGPTVDERVKPDITSTGDQVLSSVNSFDITQTSFAQEVEFNGKNYGFRRFSGTSMSGPMTAGIVALMLEAHPTLSAMQAREVLKKTARLDQHTGDIPFEEGHIQWGWGKANALAAVKAVEMIASTKEIQLKENIFNLYPNPADHQVTIKLETASNEVLKSVDFFNIDGKESKQVTVEQGQTAVQVNISDLPAGVYLVRVATDSSFSMKRLVVQ